MNILPLAYILLWCSVVLCNTEVYDITIPSSFNNSLDVIPYDELIKLTTSTNDINNAIKITTQNTTKLHIDFLRIARRRSELIVNSRNLAPVSVWLEIIDLVPGENYNFKFCWSALSPLNLEMISHYQKGVDGYDHAYIKLQLMPNFYASSRNRLEKYLNDVIIDISCVNDKLKKGLFGWIVLCIVSAFVVLKCITDMIKVITI